jgi:hypothetical protein
MKSIAELEKSYPLFYKQYLKKGIFKIEFSGKKITVHYQGGTKKQFREVELPTIEEHLKQGRKTR